MFSVSGKVIVLTGATGVLCGAMARFLAEQDAKVVLVGRNKQKGESLQAEIEQEGKTALFVAADVLTEADVVDVKEQALKHFGTIDILINGAGGNRPDAVATDERSFFDIPLEAVKGVFDLNFLGTILPSQVIGQVFAEQGFGVILNVSSMAANRPLTKVISYSAAKAGIDNFTKWLAVYMNLNYSPNIRVNAIAPGFFLTQQNYGLVMDEASDTPNERGNQILSHTPMGRFGEPQDLLGTVFWLISDAAKFVNGVVVPVDGGFSAYSGV